MAKQRRLSRKEKRRIERDQDHMMGILNTKFQMRKIRPLTPSQADLFESYQEGYNIAAIGTAGTGKTMCATYLALQDVLQKGEYEKVVIIRSAVQTREQGFMPGTQAQKEAVFEAPYADIASDLFERKDAYQLLKQKGIIEFKTSSFVRGLTFDNAIIVVDECQSMTYHELDSIITRVGESSKIVFCGDTKQDDLQQSKNRNDVTGLHEFMKVLNAIKSFDVIRFGIDDIVRSGLVKEYIMAKERLLEVA
jgi:phosphate starvation-inducible protein PhoH|tara:strand:+ start:388 stop:1137 length:750 start_codon:yes stop_codon:yes gene_type:complete